MGFSLAGSGKAPDMEDCLTRRPVPITCGNGPHDWQVPIGAMQSLVVQGTAGAPRLCTSSPRSLAMNVLQSLLAAYAAGASGTCAD
ncbi:hypothetical protein A9G05_08670 [Pseudomonas sp. ENNP23]|nr:hypothetical protein A9G05_08670 [Pseudomonas sp. ENNP23]